MYKIMLADDEGIVIDSLKFIIEKEFKDTCEVQYAKTGRSVTGRELPSGRCGHGYPDAGNQRHRCYERDPEKQ